MCLWGTGCNSRGNGVSIYSRAASCPGKGSAWYLLLREGPPPSGLLLPGADSLYCSLLPFGAQGTGRNKSQQWGVGEAFWCGGWEGALDGDGAGLGLAGAFTLKTPH